MLYIFSEFVKHYSPFGGRGFNNLLKVFFKQCGNELEVSVSWHKKVGLCVLIIQCKGVYIFLLV